MGNQQECCLTTRVRRKKQEAEDTPGKSRNPFAQFPNLSNFHNEHLPAEEKWKSESHSVVSDSLWPHGLYSPWNSPGQNTRVGSLSLPQGIFPIQESNWGLLHCRWILYQLSHKGSPRILEWVAYLFSRRSSWPRNQTQVSCIVSGFSTNWGMREVLPAEEVHSYVSCGDSPCLSLEWPMAIYISD